MLDAWHSYRRARWMPQRLCMEEIHSKSRQDLNLEKWGGEKEEILFKTAVFLQTVLGLTCFRNTGSAKLETVFFSLNSWVTFCSCLKLLVLWSLLVDISTLAQNLKWNSNCYIVGSWNNGGQYYPEKTKTRKKKKKKTKHFDLCDLYAIYKVLQFNWLLINHVVWLYIINSIKLLFYWHLHTNKLFCLKQSKSIY